MRINIYVKDEEVYKYIKSQPNYSAYIVQLVRNDMNKSAPVDESRVIELIKQYLGNSSNTSDTEIKESIQELLDL